MKGKVRINKLAEFDEDNMEHGKYYAFFHRPRYQALPPRWYERLLDSAQRSVDIWDPYFNYNTNYNDNDCRIFKHLKNSVKFRYLMVEDDGKFEGKVSTWEPVIANMIAPALKPGMDVTFAYISPNTDFGAKWEFHDRFLIIDDDRFFLVGSSVGYHLSSKASTGIFELTEDEDKSLVKDLFDMYWEFARKQKHLKRIAL